MKWVLLFGLVVGLAYGRTIFDYERDGLDNKQEGLPGQSVSGQYEWRAPDGKVTEINYVADHLGFRLVDDAEIKEPSEPYEPSSPSESTAQASTKMAKADKGGEEEEEEEEEGEENEAEERDADEEGEEEEEESSQGKSKEEKKEKSAEGANEEESEAKTKADAPETEKAEGTEVKTKTEDTETKTDENIGKDISKSPEKAKEKTDEKEDIETTGPPTDTVVVTEVKSTEETATPVETPALVPVKVESTFVETPINVEPAIVAEAPVIAVAEESPVVAPMVTPVQGFITVPTSEIPVSSDVLVVGLSEDKEVRTPVAVAVQGKDLSSGPTANPAVEIEPLQVPIVSISQAEPLQQPVVEVSPVLSESPIPVSVSVDRDIETPGERIFAVEPATLPSQSSVIFSEIPQASPLFEVQSVSSASAPEPVNVAPQEFQVFEVSQQAPALSPEQLFPSALPQIQVFQLDTSSVPVARTLETDPTTGQNPSAVLVGEVSDADVTLSSASSADSINVEPSPVLAVEIPQHRFQVAKAGRSMDSAPVQVVKEHDPFTDLYFIPESFQLSEPKPSQSSVQVVEVEVPAPQKEMIFKAKSLSQANEIQNLEVSAGSLNDLDKPVLMFADPATDSINTIPDYSVHTIQEPMISQADFLQAPDSVSNPVQYVQVPVSVVENQGAIASPRIANVDIESVPLDDFTVLSASPATSVASTPEREVTLVALDENPMISDDVFLTDASAPSPKGRAATQTPPLLPPLMKMSRILNVAI